MKNKILVSIIIVHYKAKKELFICLDSLLKHKSRIPYEIIVVDNDEEESIKKEIQKNYPSVVYVKSPHNGGYTGGNNIGAGKSQADYLFFLNPDTIVSPDVVENLVSFLKNNPDAGIAAPLLLDPDQNLYPLQGTAKLTPISGIFAFTFVNRMFPNNPISRKFWLKDWDKKSTREVDVVPGTAFMIRSTLFEEIGGFDQHYFLFFDESDICKRVQEKGYKNYIVVDAKIVHIWGKSTAHRSDIQQIFNTSRFYYFKKNYGIFSALVVQSALSINKRTVSLLCIILSAAFLRIYQLENLMPFMGDQGWFYLSAKDMVTNGTIPLVGITASHTWLHQGPLWTYMLAFGLWVTHGNPISGGYIAVFFGILTVYLVYFLGKDLFSYRIGIISALLFAVSPLAIVYSRMPYHTAPIPFFSVLFLIVLWKWIQGNKMMFPVLIFLLGILYNLELATVLFVIPLIVFLFYGIVKKTPWAQIFSIKILGLSLIAFIVSMFPILLYDIGHGFPQTLKFAAWLGYQPMKLIGIHIKTPIPGASFDQVWSFFLFQYQRLVFLPNFAIATSIFIVSILGNFGLFLKRTQQNKPIKNYLLLYISFIILLAGFFATKTISEAYLPMLFPLLFLLLALVLDVFFKQKPLQLAGIGIAILLVVGNILCLFQKNYFITPQQNPEGFTYGPALGTRIRETEAVVRDANGQPFSFKRGGSFLMFDTGADNYLYLLWWKGAKLGKNESLQYTIYQSNEGKGKSIYSDQYINIVKSEF